MSQVLSLLCMKLLITIMLLHPHKRHAVCFSAQEHQIAAHEQLYQDAIRRRLRQEELAHWFPEDVTFQPTLETGGHHADSTKVMADPTLNVSDRSALFVVASVTNVSTAQQCSMATMLTAPRSWLTPPSTDQQSLWVTSWSVSLTGQTVFVMCFG